MSAVKVKPYTVRVTPELQQEIEYLAELFGVSPTRVVTVCVDAGVRGVRNTWEKLAAMPDAEREATLRSVTPVRADLSTLAALVDVQADEVIG